VVCVLGNHDLHLLAQREGVIPARRRDTLASLLAAPDAGRLCEWVAGLPFIHLEDGYLLVHAGVPPGWSLPRIESGARAAGRALAADRAGFLRALYAFRGDRSPEDGEGRAGSALEAAVTAASVFTRIRVVDPEGNPAYDFDGLPEDVPPGHRPWFEAGSLPEDRTVLFGHWAALGLMVSERAIGLDSGCVWNGSLTALRLEDGELRIQPAAAGDGRPL
jgi:bis(5'-nucleosyl)-tetraphosphatase (symmetrical)